MYDEFNNFEIMLFNSFQFLIFFPLVCLVYFLLPHKLRWMWLLGASYYFYMNWEPIYALLIFGSTLTTYVSGIIIDKYRSENKKGKGHLKAKISLVVCLMVNLGILFGFKYFNFINESVFSVLEYFGIRWDIPNLDILLPVGISFYTFQAIGYSIDVYRGTIKAERHFGIYALFVSFFPQLVAGPIERSSNLLPQFKEKHFFDVVKARDGFTLMLWGYFMKLCVGDRLAVYVDAVYNNADMHNGTSLMLATFFFTIQIYCDFAGYSLIAIGCAKIMGYDLMENFRRPYFSQSIKEFWGRWHISLSTWFRDYLYIPLGGNRVKYSRHLLNLFITFLVSGVWHGASWNFVIWGALHGLFIIIDTVFPLNRSNSNKSVVRCIRILYTFVLVSFAWIFFRAETVEHSFLIIEKIFTNSGPLFSNSLVFSYGIMSLMILIIKEYVDEFKPNIRFLNSDKVAVRYTTQLFLIIYILLFAVLDGGQFIYFQF